MVGNIPLPVQQTEIFVPAVSPHNLLRIFSLLLGWGNRKNEKKEKASVLCKQYLTTAKILLCYHPWFCHKIKILSFVPRKLL